MTTAASVFMELGFAGSSMGEIARRAGVSKNTIYARYATKTELFSGVMRWRADRLLPRFTRTLLTDQGLETTLQTFGEGLLEVVLEPESMAFRRRMISEAVHFPEIAREYWSLGPARSRKLLGEYLQTQALAGAIVLRDPHLAATEFIALIQGDFVIRAELGIEPAPAPEKRVAVVRGAVQLFLGAYGAPAPGQQRELLSD